MIKILNALGRKEDGNLPHTHLFDDEEKQTIKWIVPRCNRSTWKAEWMVDHRAWRTGQRTCSCQRKWTLDPWGRDRCFTCGGKR